MGKWISHKHLTKVLLFAEYLFEENNKSIIPSDFWLQKSFLFYACCFGWKNCWKRK